MNYSHYDIGVLLGHAYSFLWSVGITFYILFGVIGVSSFASFGWMGLVMYVVMLILIFIPAIVVGSAIAWATFRLANFGYNKTIAKL